MRPYFLPVPAQSRHVVLSGILPSPLHVGHVSISSASSVLTGPVVAAEQADQVGERDYADQDNQDPRLHNSHHDSLVTSVCMHVPCDYAAVLL